jgi:toxin-antitoxin system PIN domain toxin
VPGTLFDTNVWLAAVFPAHPFHSKAQHLLLQTSTAQPAVWCRATQQSFLRLATTPALLKAYGAESMTNRDALYALDAFQTLPQVTFHDEPPGLFALWRSLAGLPSASPKVWMDAYLAAFAIAGGLRMATLDADFKAFVPNGLVLDALN